MAALHTGGNVLSRQPTGSGKSYCYLLPTLARWAAIARARTACANPSTRAKLPLPPITMVVAPWRELCKDGVRMANKLIEELYASELLPTVEVLDRQMRARALFVDRDGEEKAELSRDAPADTPGMPTPEGIPKVVTLPCGRCTSCIGGAPNKCWWCCRIAYPGERPDERWCDFCNSSSGNGKRVLGHGGRGCSLHLAAKLRGASATLPTPTTMVDPAARRQRADTTTPTSPASAVGTSSQDESSQRPLRMRDLPRHAPERVILEDASLSLCIVTPDALRSSSDRGVLLRQAIARSGRCSLLVIDEAHACLHISQGAFREACALLGVTQCTLALAMEARGFDRFQLLALSGTVPPGKYEREVMHRLRLGVEGVDCTVLRGSVDRESIAMTRCFMPELAGESNARYVLRAWRLVDRLAPTAARRGRRGDGDGVSGQGDGDRRGDTIYKSREHVSWASHDLGSEAIHVLCRMNGFLERGCTVLSHSLTAQSSLYIFSIYSR